MTDDRKRELAQKIVDLSVMNRAKSVASDNNGPNAELTANVYSKMRKQQIALHCKHFEIDQLQALVEFYNTEIGKSILESQERVSDELSVGLAGKRFRTDDA